MYQTSMKLHDHILHLLSSMIRRPQRSDEPCALTVVRMCRIRIGPPHPNDLYRTLGRRRSGSDYRHVARLSSEYWLAYAKSDYSVSTFVTPNFAGRAAVISSITVGKKLQAKEE